MTNYRDTNYRDNNLKQTDFEYMNRTPSGLNSTLSWRSVLAGFFVASFTYALLLALGLGVGGLSINVLTLDNIEGFSIAGGIWIAISGIVALFAGGFITSRMSTSAESRIGALQGLTMASLFFFVMALQVGIGIGSLGSGAMQGLGMTAQGSMNILQQPKVQSVIEETLGSIELKQPTGEFISGVGSRLLQQRYDAARNYVTNNSNLNATEAQSRIQNLRSEFESAVADSRDEIAGVVATVGWISFLMLLLGGAAAGFGGMLGSRSNDKHPIATREARVVDKGGVKLAS